MCDSIHGFCDRNCDKLFLEKLQITDNTPIFRVKGEKMAVLVAPEICREEVISRFQEICVYCLE